MLKITMGIDQFNPWSGAVDTWERIEEEGKIDDLENLIEEIYPEGIGETELNDILWFDSAWVFESLGMLTDDYIEEVKNFAKEVISDLSGYEVELKHVLETLAYSEYMFDIDYYFDSVYDQEVCVINLSLDDQHISRYEFHVVEKYEKEEDTILII